MSEKRFSLSNPITHNPIPSWIVIVHDDKEHKHLNAEAIVDLLNEQQDTISTLKEENEQLRQQVQILKKEVRDFLHLCDVCDIQSHLSDECEEVLNDE